MSDENISLAPLKVGMLGLSIDAIDQGKWGYVYLPLGNRDTTFAGGRVWIRIKVRVIESVRAERDIIVANDQGEVKEHTPVELSYQTVTGITIGSYQRVTEAYPLPITDAYEYDDYTEIDFTSSESNYTIGTNAKAADSSLPSTFEGKSILFFATQNCKIRFNGLSRVQHYLNSGVYYSFNVRTSIIYVVRDTADGTLQIWVTG